LTSGDVAWGALKKKERSEKNDRQSAGREGKSPTPKSPCPHKAILAAGKARAANSRAVAKRAQKKEGGDAGEVRGKTPTALKRTSTTDLRANAPKESGCQGKKGEGVKKERQGRKKWNICASLLYAHRTMNRTKSRKEST